MPCGPASGAMSQSRSNEQILDPFSFSHTSALFQSWSNMTMFWAAPFRAAMVLAGEAVRSDGQDG